MGSVMNWRGKEEQIVDKASITLISKLDKYKKIKPQASISHEDRPQKLASPRSTSHLLTPLFQNQQMSQGKEYLKC